MDWLNVMVLAAFAASTGTVGILPRARGGHHRRLQLQMPQRAFHRLRCSRFAPHVARITRTDSATSSRSTPWSMSLRRLMYRHDLPVLYLPSFASSSA